IDDDASDHLWRAALYDDLISETDIRDKVVKLAKNGVQVLLVIDSCHSGAVVIKEPNVVVMTACAANEVALFERFQGGVFTRILLEGLGGAADANNDGTITQAELEAYVAKRMPQQIAALREKYPLESDKVKDQHPTAAGTETCPELPLAKVEHKDNSHRSK